MRLRTGQIKISIQRAIIALTIKFDKIGRIKLRIRLALDKNGLFCAAVKNIYPSGINRGQRNASRLEVGIGDFINPILCNGDLIIGLRKVDPLV